jgi:hypothetical protein
MHRQLTPPWLVVLNSGADARRPAFVSGGAAFLLDSGIKTLDQPLQFCRLRLGLG